MTASLPGMSSLHGSLWAGACGLLCACTTQPETTPVPRYPHIELSPALPTLEVSKDAEALTLVCQPREWDNGVDDNCNGHIDEGYGGTEGALELALSWSGPDDVTLVTEPELPQREEPCEPPRACLIRGHLEKLPEGSVFTVSVQREKAEKEIAAAPTTVSLSLAAQGESLGAINAQVLPGQRVELARITVP